MKYSTLPDVDTTSKDVYESEQVAPVPNYARPETRRSSIDESEVAREDAKQVFESTEVEGSKEVNYSDSVAFRQNYRVRSIPETLEARIARLQREVEEVRQQAGGSQHAMDNLRDVLDKLASGGGGGGGGGDYTLFETMGEQTSSTTTGSGVSNTGKMAKENTERLVDLDQRLSKLEKTIGHHESPIEPALNELRQKLSLLTTTNGSASSSHFDTTKLRELSTYADKIRNAKEPVSPNAFETRRILALYDKLASFEQMEVVVPHMVTRLKSLNTVHADATTAVNTVRDVDATVDSMKTEIEKWVATIKSAEGKLKESQAQADKNKQQIEQWVRDLEARVEKVDRQGKVGE